MASMWWGLYVVMSREVSLVQIIAIPPLWPLLGTKRQFMWDIDLLFLFDSFLFSFVSARKTILGAYRCINSRSTLTVREFPSPRQFHPRSNIAPSGVARQPPPIYYQGKKSEGGGGEGVVNNRFCALFSSASNNSNVLGLLEPTPTSELNISVSRAWVWW